MMRVRITVPWLAARSHPLYDARMSEVPASRIRACNDRPVDPAGSFVLYWMIAARRTHHSFGLQRAVERAVALGKPLVVLEALRVGYRWASDRIHRFILDGMADNAHRFSGTEVGYYPYVERSADEGKGLFEALAARAAVVVTDDFPAFFLPRMVAAAAAQSPVLVEKIDGNGLYPMRDAERVFTTAASFRRHLQKHLREHLGARPKRDPLAGVKLRQASLPTEITRRWPRADAAVLRGDAAALAALPIDHSVPVAPRRGGAEAAEKVLRSFLDHKLARYAEERNDPDADAASGLSPYLHFGHVSVHEVFDRLMKRAGWTEQKLAPKAHGSREKWWNASPEADAFLDEIVTWRELGYNMCALRDDYDHFETLPAFALQTLNAHARDPRPILYSPAELEAADTHDQIWNAAQRELVREGRMHNYLRMLWGKKVLEWSRTPEQALSILIELNNKYALDGRDPNSYSGIFWVFGRYDRAWGPERPIFGKIRYMSSESTLKKLSLRSYLERYGR
ncbi:Deoxyribodipyrimidine photolyase, type II [Minicystis rosea]|nr:Deoxyribodipyrimidine photolyase, type II [Minicystis rosea]